MRTRRIAALAVGGLLLAACGSDDGGGAGGAQGDAADAAIEAASAEGIELDEGCVNDVAGQLSDADAEAIVDAGPDGEAELSPEGETLTRELLSCVDSEALVDQFIAGMAESGQEFDEACAREQLEGFDLAELVTTGDEQPPTELIQAMVECIDLGGG